MQLATCNELLTMAPDFFPRSRTFWLYHGSALAAGLMVTIGMAAAWGFMASYQIASSIAWLPVYTLAVLGFRWLYLRHGGHGVGMGKLIACAALYSALAGILMAVVLQSAIVPLFLAAFQARYPLQAGDLGNLIVQRVIADMPQNQMFVLVWSFIYVSVTANRRIRDSELSNLRLQHSLKEAQLSSLSNQLNPHFLFNSLNNIRFMIHEDAGRADAMITSFSEILRYSLDSSLHDKVGLGAELAIIRQYLAIVEIQLEERLAIELRVPVELHGALVPPMVLHMLAENAIKHGLEQLPRGGQLVLAASGHGDRLRFVVANDTPAGQQERPGLGIGLHNIRQRLALLYGGAASLGIERTPGRFTVELALPLERAA